MNLHLDLLQEHISEASFLHELRFSLISNSEITWLDFDDFEQRFEAHIDGLVVGGEEALVICQQQAIEGDAGEVHAAVRVFCRQQRLDLLKDVLSRIEPEETEKWQAITDALQEEMLPAWLQEFYVGDKDDTHTLAQIFPAVAGYQRIKMGLELDNALKQTTNPALQEQIIWALGRLREVGARESLFNEFSNHSENRVRRAALLALLRLGEAAAVQHCSNEVHSPWSHMLLALSGGSKTAAEILAELSGKTSATAQQPADPVQAKADGVAWTRANTEESLLALGIAGNIAAVPFLLSLFADPKRAPSAALALNLITAAGLYEEVFIPEPIDEDELFEDELEKYRKGEPLYTQGEEPGTTISRLSLKADEWQAWWDQNKAGFDSRLRYRNGKPFSPSCLLENLESEKSPPVIRQLAYEELVIRYGGDFPFETEMFVGRQLEALAKYQEWINLNESRFQPGVWYFAGRPLSQ